MTPEIQAGRVYIKSLLAMSELALEGGDVSLVRPSAAIARSSIFEL